MAERILGLGLVGCGEIAVLNADAVRDSGNARVAAVMDVNETLARDLGQKHGAPWFLKLEEMLARPEVEAVFIATPHHLHLPQAAAAAGAGRHVLVEKPISTTVDKADEMIAVCRYAGVKLSVNFAYRYEGWARKARALIQAGAIGNITGFQVSYVGDKPESYWQGGYSGRIKTDWRMRRDSSGGGVLIMNVIHEIDLLRHLTGLEITRVSGECATMATPGVDVEDFAFAALRLSNGGVGGITATSCGPGGQGLGTRIYGEKGQIALGAKLRAFLKEPFEKEGPPLKAGEWIEVPYAAPKNYRALGVAQFAQAVIENRDPEITCEDGRAALAVVEAAYRSSETGTAVATTRLP